MTQLEIERKLLALPREEVQGTPLAAPLAQLRQAQADDNFEAEMAASGRLRQAYMALRLPERG